jgi:hypothetical protein
MKARWGIMGHVLIEDEKNPGIIFDIQPIQGTCSCKEFKETKQICEHIKFAKEWLVKDESASSSSNVVPKNGTSEKPTNKSNENADVKYFGISGVQKAIRRGNKRLALISAKAAWSTEQYNLFRRLFTILFEDCGRDKKTLEFFANTRGTYKDWEYVKSLVIALVESKKSQEQCYIIRPVKAGKECFPKDLLLLGARVLKEQPPEQRNYGEEYPAWIVDFIKRTEKLDWEKFGLLVPYFIKNEDSEKVHTFDEDAPGVEATYEDMLMLSAVDIHTKVGKICSSIFYKENKAELERLGVIDGQTLGEVFWYNIGRKKRNRMVDMLNGTDICEGFDERECPYLYKARDWMFAHVEDFYKIMRWGIRTMAPQSMEEFREFAFEVDKEEGLIPE